MIPMLKNPNQKVIKRMAGNALKVNRRKTITLFLAVLLSSFLVFTIFTVGDSYFRLQKIQNIRMSGADFVTIISFKAVGYLPSSFSLTGSIICVQYPSSAQISPTSGVES